MTEAMFLILKPTTSHSSPPFVTLRRNFKQLIMMECLLMLLCVSSCAFRWNKLLHDSHFSLVGRVGCPHYISPEVLARRQYGKACDVWGAGVMLHVLLSGRLPFNGSGRRLQEAITRGRVMVSWQDKTNIKKDAKSAPKLSSFAFNWRFNF